MNEEIIHIILLASSFLILFTSAEILYHKFNVEAELTRKYVHIVTGLLTMLFPQMLTNHWSVLILCASFLLILITSLKFNLLPSINNIDRVSRGSILYPIVVYSCYLMSSFHLSFTMFYIPILILAISDPLAALIGRKWSVLVYTTFGYNKSLGGSLAFFLSSFLISYLLLTLFESEGIIYISVLVAVLTTFTESISHKGYDNLTIPIAAMLPLMLI